MKFALGIFVVLGAVKAMAGAIPSPEMLCYEACIDKPGKSHLICLRECGYGDPWYSKIEVAPLRNATRMNK